MQSQSLDPSLTRSGRSSPESSPNPSLPSDPIMSRNMTTSRNRKLPSQSELTSSPESSAVTETAPSSASPAVQPSPIQALKLQVGAAREKEGKLRTALAETYQRKKMFFKRAENTRQRVKSREGRARILHEKVKVIRAENKKLKDEAQADEKDARAIESTYPDLEEESNKAEDERVKLESKLKDLEQEEELIKLHPDPVVRELIKRAEGNKEIEEIFENLEDAKATIEDVEALEGELNSICEQLIKEKAETLDGSHGTSETKEVKWEDVEVGTKGTRSDFTDSEVSGLTLL
jgi:chromosome segregation ATPase